MNIKQLLKLAGTNINLRAITIREIKAGFIALRGTFRDVVFENVDFTEVDLSESYFVNCGFFVSFKNCNFEKSRFKKCVFVNSDFSGNMYNTNFTLCQFSYIDFHNSDLTLAEFNNIHVVGHIWPDTAKTILEAAMIA